MKLRRKVAAGISLLTASVLGLTGLAPAQAANKSDLVLGVVVLVKSWEPSQADIGHGIQYYQAVYDNLILREPNGSYKPNLATKWTINKTFTEVTFDLRSGVTFTDGTKFDADAAVANMNAFIAGNGPQASTFAGAQATKVDADTFKLTLANPIPDILFYISTTNSFMASPKAIGTAGLKTTPVGSGPYIYSAKESVAGSKAVFTANPKYWDKSKQKFKKLTYLFMEQITTRVNALRSGQIDGAILDVANSSIAKSAGLTLTTWENDWAGLLIFDRAGKLNEALGKKEVRQALNYAIDRAALLRTVQGGKGKVTNQVFSPTSNVYDKKLEIYSYNPAKAKELLAKAGYPNGFTLKMPYIPSLEPRASFVATYFKAVGVTIEWETVTDYRTAVLSAKYGVVDFQLQHATPLVHYNLAIAPDGPRNILKYTDDTIKTLDASITKDPSAKNVLTQLKKVNKHIVDNAWFVPFYTVPQMYYTSKRIKTQPQVNNAVPYLYSYSPSGK